MPAVHTGMFFQNQRTPVERRISTTSQLAWMRAMLLGFALQASVAHAADAFKFFKPVMDGEGQLTVAAVMVTEPPYNADSTGKSDVSAVLQRAMGDTAAHGGGTVYLPAGFYRLDKSLTVPPTVTLGGQWHKPEAGQPLSGTVLLAFANKQEADGPPLLAAPKCGHANVYNLTIYYPEQNPAAPIPYPFSIEGRVAYVRNITLLGSYQGILMSDFSGSSVAGIYGTVLKRGLVLKSSCELCTCFDVHLVSDYWARLPEAKIGAAAAGKLRQFIAQNLVGVQVGKVDGFSFLKAELAGAQTPVLVKTEDDEAKVMIAPRNQYGFGGGCADVSGRRTEVGTNPWYFGTHYFDLDNYPELAGKHYSFAELRQAARSGRDTVAQAGDFGVQADGASDDSQPLQQALDQTGQAGGGTVLLPRGVTRLKTPITIPSGVELRGGYLGPAIRFWYQNVSTLLIDCDADAKNPESDRAAISLAANAGLRGVAICHAKNLGELNAQGQLMVHPYPYVIRGLGKGIYVTDVIIPNAFNGIDLGLARCDQAQIVNLWGTFFRHGIRVGAQSDAVQLENINIDRGPLGSDARLTAQGKAPSNRDEIFQGYLDEHAVNFIFGDCTRLTTFALAGFAPHRFMEFVDQGHGGCHDAEFWSSIFDVPKVETARFHSGGKISFFGLFATGGRNHHSLWAEFDPTFQGQVQVYGLCQQLTFNNRPYNIGPEKLEIHLEHSLSTGRPASASSSAAGCGPEKALDANPRTCWQSADGAGPHLLTVQLAEPAIITRWRVHNAGNFISAACNTRSAELHGSADGIHYFKIAAFTNNIQAWVDLPVSCAQPARYVQLRVLKAQQPGSLSNCALVAAFDVFGTPVREKH